jgi:DNA-binding beta-propeller fold protein YncE
MPDSTGGPVLLFFAFKFSQELRMLQKALVLVFVFASIASFISCGSTTSHFLFATLPAANQVASYRVDPNSGVLTQIAGSPFPAGDGAQSLVIHPSGKFLYVANPGLSENDISLFTIASDGVLTEVTPRTSVAPLGTLPQLLAMDPAGNYLYVANAGSNNISVFSIASGSGALAAVTGSPFFIGLAPLNMQVAPSGNFLYVSSATSLSGTSAGSGSIAGFSVNAGILTLVGLTSTDGIDPAGLAIDPTSTFLYVANTRSSTISIFTIDSSGGGLTEVSGSPLNDVDQDPNALIVDPTGKFLYVAHGGSSNNIATYSIPPATGFPVVISDSPFASEGNPSFLAADPSGKYLYVGNQPPGSPGIQAFGVAGGSLNTIFTYGVGNTPSSIAVLQ